MRGKRKGKRVQETRYKFVDRSNETTPATLVIPEVNYCPICGCKLEEWPDRAREHIWSTYCDGCKNRCTIWVLH